MGRTLSEGQWLGTSNRIVRMQYFERTGWTATDSTGERYQQRTSRVMSGPAVVPLGLKTADEPMSCVDLERTPWPPDPKAVK